MSAWQFASNGLVFIAAVAVSGLAVWGAAWIWMKAIDEWLLATKATVEFYAFVWARAKKRIAVDARKGG